MGGLAAAGENRGPVKKKKLENVSIANALQLEAARRAQSQSALIRRPWQV